VSAEQGQDLIELYIRESSLRIQSAEKSLEQIVVELGSLQDRVRSSEAEVIRLQEWAQVKDRVAVLEQETRSVVSSLTDLRLELRDRVHGLESSLQLRNAAQDKDLAHEKGKLHWLYAGLSALVAALAAALVALLLGKK